MSTQTTIADRISEVQDRIAAAARRSGRSAADIQLVAVTKTHPVESIREAIGAGVLDLGENRVQEAIPKIQNLQQGPNGTSAARFHLIGHLQSNKAKQAVQYFDLIHSLDTAALAAELHKQAVKQSKHCRILIQVNVSGEMSKSGIQPSEAPPLIDWILTNCPVLRVEGFMTMAPFTDTPEDTRVHFRNLRRLSEQSNSRFGSAIGGHLSMGMTNDFEIAIEEGATLVRVGSAIFRRSY